MYYNDDEFWRELDRLNETSYDIVERKFTLTFEETFWGKRGLTGYKF